MPTGAAETLLPADAEGEGDEGCVFVLDPPDGGVAPKRFCGAARRYGSAYCSAHHASCHVATGSSAERARLREIEALAQAIGGKAGSQVGHPSPRALRRLDRLARSLSRPRCS